MALRKIPKSLVSSFPEFIPNSNPNHGLHSPNLTTAPTPTLLSLSPSPPASLLPLLRSHFPTPSSLTASSLLRFLSRRLRHHPSLSAHDLTLLLWASRLAPSHFSHDHRTLLLLARSLASTRRLDPLLPLIRSLGPTCPCSQNSIFSCPHLPAIYRVAIDAFLSAGRLSDASDAFHDLQKSIDGRPDPALYNIMINGFAKNGDHQKAVHWYEKMIKDRVKPDVYTFNILISSSIRNCSGGLDSAMEWFKDMREKGLEPNVVSFNTLIKGFFKEKRFNEGIGVAHEMLDLGYLITSGTCKVLMNGLCKEGRASEMCNVLMGFLRRGVVPDEEFDCLVLVEALCGEGKAERAMELVEQLWDNGKAVNVVTCSTLMEGLRNGGKIDEAIGLMERTVEKGTVPDGITCNCLLEDLCKSGRTVEANRLRVLASTKGFEPDSVTFGILVRGFSREGRRTEGTKIVDEMLDADLIPNIATYNHLMDGLQCRGKRCSR